MHAEPPVQLGHMPDHGIDEYAQLARDIRVAQAIGQVKTHLRLPARQAETGHAAPEHHDAVNLPPDGNTF